MQRCGFVATFRKQRRAESSTDYETWILSDVANTINLFDASETRSATVVVVVKEDGTEDTDGEEIL